MGKGTQERKPPDQPRTAKCTAAAITKSYLPTTKASVGHRRCGSRRRPRSIRLKEKMWNGPEMTKTKVEQEEKTIHSYILIYRAGTTGDLAAVAEEAGLVLRHKEFM